MTTDGARGKVVLFSDFANATDLTNTGEEVGIGDFRFFGQGTAELDSGCVSVAVPSGAVRVTTTNEAAHSAAVGTHQMFTPSLNGTISLECRVQLNNLDTKTVFIGFSDDAATTAIAPATGATTTITLADSDICGFLIDSQLTSDEEWHFVHNGGASAGVVDSTALVSGVDAVAAEWDILRIEIDTNGTARWYINGTLGKTLAGAVATTTNFAAYTMVQAEGAAVEEMDLDYLLVRGARDWTR